MDSSGVWFATAVVLLVSTELDSLTLVDGNGRLSSVVCGRSVLMEMDAFVMSHATMVVGIGKVRKRTTVNE